MKDRDCLPCRAHGGHGLLSIHLSSSTLLLPRSLVLAAVLVVVTGARVALAPSHRDAVGALAAGTTTWILSGRGNVAADHLTIRFVLKTSQLLTSKSAPQCPASRQGCRWT